MKHQVRLENKSLSPLAQLKIALWFIVSYRLLNWQEERFEAGTVVQQKVEGCCSVAHAQSSRARPGTNSGLPTPTFWDTPTLSACTLLRQTCAASFPLPSLPYLWLPGVPPQSLSVSACRIWMPFFTHAWWSACPPLPRAFQMHLSVVCLESHLSPWVCLCAASGCLCSHSCDEAHAHHLLPQAFQMHLSVVCLTL